MRNYILINLVLSYVYLINSGKFCSGFFSYHFLEKKITLNFQRNQTRSKVKQALNNKNLLSIVDLMIFTVISIQDDLISIIDKILFDIYEYSRNVFHKSSFNLVSSW